MEKKKFSIKELLKKFVNLETIEEKSYWIIAPIVVLLGIIALATSGSFNSPLPPIISAIMCFIIPVVISIFTVKTKNYHIGFPILCISVGAISIPATFIFSGGFLSGMPLFCVITTVITALIYNTKWRVGSLIACILGNTAAFIYVYINGTPFPLKGTEALYSNIEVLRSIYNDILFAYYGASIGTFLALNFITNDIRKYKFNQDTFQRFFDIEKRKEILNKSIKGDLSLKSEKKKAVILFADISNFTPITEKMPSEMISDFLNEFFEAAGKLIHDTGGIIDKYIGDCIMAYWIDNGEDNCVLKAVQSMLSLKIAMIRDAERIFTRYGTELNFSVGISYGDVIFGDIGSESMHDYTVLGDAVNTASRIQSSAVGGEMLISDQAAEMIKDKVNLENVESEHFFKGKNKSTGVYRIVGLSSEKVEREIIGKVDYGYKLHICGCRGSFPVSGLRFSEYGGETSCYTIIKGDYAVIIDCGTGLKNAMPLVRGCKNIDILLTHVHYDHILGFLMSRFPSNAHIRIFGHFDVWDKKMNTLKDFMEHPYWPVEIVSTEKVNVNLDEEIELKKDIVATFYESDHPDNACVIKLMCKDKKIVFLADCENANDLPQEISQDSDLLFFDGMFDETDPVDHLGWGHGTWQGGVRFVKGKNIKKLVITHHNPELGDHTLMTNETMAHEMQNNVSFAKSGDVFGF